jgi:glutathione S-transferase
MNHGIVVWGVGTSRTIRVHWMLIELGLEYECHRIRSRTGETRTETFRQLNPRHKIPVLVHCSFVLTESAAIIQYLCERFPHPDIYAPVDAVSRARLQEWCHFIMAELDAGALYVLRRHDDLKAIYGEAPAAVEAARAYFLHHLDAMTGQIDRHGTYLLGDRLSTADVLLMTCLDWAVHCGISLPEVAARYQRRVAVRPAYERAFRENFPAE